MAEVLIVQTLQLETVAEVTDEEMRILKSEKPEDKKAKDELQTKLAEIATDHSDFRKWRDHAESLEWVRTDFFDGEEELFDVG